MPSFHFLPYNLRALSKVNRGLDVIKASPYGNTLTADFAMAAITAESLGRVIAPLRSRCLMLRISCPEYEEIE